MCSAISERLREGNLIVVSEWDLEQETRVCGRGEGDVHPLEHLVPGPDRLADAPGGRAGS